MIWLRQRAERLPRLKRRQRIARNLALLLLIWGSIWWGYGMPGSSSHAHGTATERRELLERGREYSSNLWGVRVAEHFYHIYNYESTEYSWQRDSYIRAIPRTGAAALIPWSYSLDFWVDALDVPPEAESGRLTLQLWGPGYDESFTAEGEKRSTGWFGFPLPYPESAGAKNAMRWLTSWQHWERANVCYEMTARFYDRDGHEVAVVRDVQNGAGEAEAK